MAPEDLSRDFGRLEADVAGLKVELVAVRKDVRELLAVVHGASMSWRVLLAIGSIVAGLTTLAASIMARLGVL